MVFQLLAGLLGGGGGGAQDAASAHNTMHPFTVQDMIIKYK